MGLVTPPVLLLALSLGGCSVLFGGSDSASDAGTAPDATPLTFSINSADAINPFPDYSPSEFAERHPLFEGTGTAGGATTWVVLHGTLIPSDLGVSVVFAQTGEALPALSIIEVLDVEVSEDGTVAAVEFLINVNRDFAGERALEMRITGAGLVAEDLPEATEAILNSSLVLVGLPELLIPAGAPVTMAAQSLQPAYSEVEILDDLNITRDESNQVARLRAAGGVRIAAAVDLSGLLGEEDGFGESGPGGCRGGLDSEAECQHDGGTSTDNEVGGGGGGHGSDGEAGDSEIPLNGNGAPGATVGDAFFSTGLTAGGGGAAGSPSPSSYGGGGGGGAVLIHARGVLDISGGSIRSNGGDGGENRGVYLGGSGGGAGAGGGILVRAESGVVSDAGSNLRAKGGTGGDGDDGTNNGGNGGDGRIRLDSSNGIDLPSLPLATIGPALVRPDSPVLRAETVSLSLVGKAPASDFIVSVNDKLKTQNLLFDEDNSDVFDDIALEVGVNLVCGYGSDDASQVARYCIELVRLP